MVGSWIRDNLGPSGIAGDLKGRRPPPPNRGAMRLPERLPDLADRTERFATELGDMAEHGLRFDEATSEAHRQGEARHTRSGPCGLVDNSWRPWSGSRLRSTSIW